MAPRRAAVSPARLLLARCLTARADCHAYTTIRATCRLSEDELFHLVYEEALNSDFRQIVQHAALPRNVSEMHDVTLQGSYVLQLERAANIAVAHEQRGNDGGAR